MCFFPASFLPRLFASCGWFRASLKASNRRFFSLNLLHKKPAMADACEQLDELVIQLVDLASEYAHVRTTLDQQLADVS